MLRKPKFINNSLSMMLNRVVQSITTFVLTVSIARILGTEALGKYLLSFSYYYIFMTIASQGLKILFTREISRQPQNTPAYLISGTFLQLILSVVAYLLLVTLIFLLPYSFDTSTLCYIVGLTLIPFSLSNITEAIFQAMEKMHLIAIATVPVYILRLIFMLWLMQLGYGIEYVSAILVISETLILGIEWIFIKGLVKIQWQIDINFIWDTIKKVRTFFALEGIAVVNSRMQILIISLLGNNSLVGIFGGITQLLQPYAIIVDSIVLATFPTLTKAVDEGRHNQRQIAENTIEILLIVSLPLSMGLMFMGKDLLSFIYSSSFAQGSVALNIVALTLIISPFNRTLSYLLVANGFEILNLLQVVINTVIGGLIGTALVLQYKLLGAATMVFAMSFIGAIQYIYFTYVKLFPLTFLQVLRRPLLISLIMLPVFVLLTQSSLNFLITLLISISVYCLIISFISVNYLGGYRTVWQKITSKL